MLKHISTISAQRYKKYLEMQNILTIKYIFNEKHSIFILYIMEIMTKKGTINGSLLRYLVIYDGLFNNSTLSVVLNAVEEDVEITILYYFLISIAIQYYILYIRRRWLKNNTQCIYIELTLLREE